jgi:hypothetical protein
MFSRRDVLASPIFTRVFAAPAPENDASQDLVNAVRQDLVRAVEDVAAAVRADRTFTDIAPVRAKQLDFLRAQGKFPDFIEVGVDVWFAVHDWHVKHLQPITIGRDAGGRYTITLMNTTVIMRPEVPPIFVGTAYDNR